MFDEHINMLLFGKTGEDRSNGKLLASILSVGAQVSGSCTNHEVFISPLPKEELFALYERRMACLQDYQIVREAYEDEHPRPEVGSYLEWNRQIDQALDSAHGHLLSIVRNIDREINEEKGKIFDDIVPQFRSTVANMRKVVLLDLIAANCTKVRELSSANAGLDRALKKFLTSYQKAVAGRATLDDIDGDELEVLERTFFQGVGRHFKKAGGNSDDLASDLFFGRIGSDYFSGPREFFHYFDWSAARRGEILCSASGMMKGEYAFMNNGYGFSFKDLPSDSAPTDNLFAALTGNLFGLVYFRMEVASRYNSCVEPVFGRIREMYNVVPAEDLRRLV
ncbi:hypothetical protein COV20_02255 [Candidatus Woesearchaeota archaeon CG10_big_fil_rev_8_21_14_0_10_45_16]|nr:MAG: hypothetical protein COV20_02255 [Candidatus Woesearchaeota archaeon CG10_big_fil_rev_8_21_14_0_10_45_16]